MCKEFLFVGVSVDQEITGPTLIFHERDGKEPWRSPVRSWGTAQWLRALAVQAWRPEF